MNVPFAATTKLNLSSLVFEGGGVMFYTKKERERQNFCALLLCGDDLDFLIY